MKDANFGTKLVFSSLFILVLCALAVTTRLLTMAIWGGKFLANDNGVIKVGGREGGS